MSAFFVYFVVAIALFSGFAVLIRKDGDAAAYVVGFIFAFGWPIVVLVGMALSPFGFVRAIREEQARRREVEARWQRLSSGSPS